MRRELKVEKLTRVEGHGAVTVVYRGSAVEDVKLKLTEGPRFFEAIVLGRLYSEIPKVVSRICGICYVSHRLTSVMAVEDAFGVKVPEEIFLLRRLLTIGEFLESHALHLYFLALPDYMGYHSAVEMAKDYPNVVKRGFLIKDTGNLIMRTIAGKNVHGENVLVGGFASVPGEEELKRIHESLIKILPEAKATVALFDSLSYPEATVSSPVSMWVSGEFPLSREGKVSLSDGRVFTKQEFELFVKEELKEYSHAKVSSLNGESYLIGPLSRVNGGASASESHLSLLKTEFPSLNPFHANVARAVELLKCVEDGIELVELLISALPFKPSVRVSPKKGVGFGVKEAPRGVLYHKYAFDDSGRCVSANIVTPTAQLQSAIEGDIYGFAERVKDLSDEEVKKKIEMLVRAYDP